MVFDSRPFTATDELEARGQGDLFEAGQTSEENLHPRFRVLRQRADLAPARDLMRELHAVAFRDTEPDYARQFQSDDFDGALFRLFLFALFDAAGHVVDPRHRDSPFVLNKAGTTAVVDAFTVGTPVMGIDPPGDAPRAPSSERPAPGIGGTLFRTLHRQQSRLPQAARHPFVIAVQDFDHLQLAKGAPPSALLHFLFGGADQPKDLVELFPGGFFGQKEAESVSGILFCNDATIAKFNRLGQEKHCGDAARMLRHGACLADGEVTSTPSGYVYEVGQAGAQREQWNEGTVLIHNPFALHPLPTDWLGASAEIELKNGQITERFARGFHPCSSHTELLGADTPAWWIERRTHLIEHEHAAHPAA
jgi:hypothetical protein